MNVTTARIATALPGFCDACGRPFANGENVHEFVHLSRGGSFVVQYATCAKCHQFDRPEGAVSASPTLVLVSGSRYHNCVRLDCTPEMGEFLARSAIEAQFPEDAAA